MVFKGKYMGNLIAAKEVLEAQGKNEAEKLAYQLESRKELEQEV